GREKLVWCLRNSFRRHHTGCAGGSSARRWRDFDRAQMRGRPDRVPGMRPLIEETVSPHSPQTLVEQLNGQPGVVLLRSALFDSPQARYSFVAARPFLTFRSVGSRCEWWSEPEKPDSHIQFGNSWHVLDG